MPTPRTWTTRKQPRAAAEEQKVTDDVGLAVTSKGRANANMELAKATQGRLQTATDHEATIAARG